MKPDSPERDKLLHPASNEEREDYVWYRHLEQLSNNWNKLELRRHWNLVWADFNRRLKDVISATDSSLLFNEAEARLKRLEHRAHAESVFIEKMQSRLKSDRWFKRKKVSHASTAEAIENLRTAFAEKSRSAEFELEYAILGRKINSIEQSTPGRLFSHQDRNQRLQPLVRTERRSFRRSQFRVLKIHRTYKKLIRSLSSDELDLQLQRLADDFHFIDQSRFWFRELEKYVEAVITSIKAGHAGENESVVRLLQNDFYLSMKQKYPLYFRFHELKQFCHKHRQADLVTAYSYFQQRQIDNHGDQDNQEQMVRFVELIEKNLRNRIDKARRKRIGREHLLAVNHEKRLVLWSAFKQNHLHSGKSIIATFNHMKPILHQCEEWQLELNVFCSELATRRLADPGRKDSQEELDAAHAFVEKMVRRVDRDISTDVAFKILEQELIREEAFQEELIQLKVKLNFERNRKVTEAADDLTRIKKEFIEFVWQQRSSDSKQSSITPLLGSTELAVLGKKMPATVKFLSSKS